MRKLIIDSFAGGGGASTGIEMALGRSPDIAINHNPAALALHAANHPETLHISENVYKVDPLDYLRGKHIGLAWFSPDCKHFSKAKGGKPVERNIRDLAWIIPGWIERIQKSGGKVDVVLMENVEEWKDWGPLIETPRGLMPCPDRRGETFEKWKKAIRKLGGKIERRESRACDYGAPTIRKRMLVIIRFDGKAIVWPEPTHGAPDSIDVLAGRKKPWRTAAEIIDWSLPCPSIFDTSEEIMARMGLRAVRPLADNTMARVARGMKRYVLDAERPFLVNLTHGARCEDINAPMNTITGANRGEKALIVPSISRFNSGATGEDLREPLSTITANSFIKRPGGVAPIALLAPHLAAYYGPGDGGQDRSAHIDEPLRTVTTENRHAVIAPILSYAQQGGNNRSVEDPMHTICASAKDQNQVACAFVAQHNNDSRREGGVNPGRKAAEPLSTVTATGAQQGVVPAFISRQFGTSTGHAAASPLGTITADGQGKSALIAPHLHAYYGVDQDTPENEPVHTLTTKPRFSHVEGKLDAPPFTVEQEGRARLVADFMRAYGFWDDREFVTLDIDGVTYVIVDICMRMLSPRELYNAQGFPPDYQIDRDLDGNVFSKSVQVGCVGNSVSPPWAEAHVAANCADMVEMLEAAE
jgi:DNA (cytosine-5)-methyltransferase 1